MMIFIIGLLAFQSLTLREYPDIKLPLVRVNFIYPGASPALMESSVINIMEDEIASIAGIKNISSSSKTNMGDILVLFEEGTDLDNALIELRDAIGQAKSKIPQDVKEPSIHKGGGFGGVPFFAVSITSSEMEFSELTHYAKRYIKNHFRSIRGVSTVEIWGSPYSMEVELDPKKLYNYGINVSDVISALKKNNIYLPTGKFREKITSSMNLKLSSEEDFSKVYIVTKNGKAIYLSDIAESKLRPDDRENRIKINGKYGVMISIDRSTNANPLHVTELLKQKVLELQNTLPKHMELNVEIDQSLFINASISNIYSSIFEAIILVLLIVFLFLGSLKATIIPLITIPISLLGSIILMMIFGMSLNVFTLLAMVLAIGLVVDDAIIVLENITRHIENGLSPLKASIKGSGEISFAIIAMTLTLASVYAPICFIQGTIGQLFREFAVALAGSVLISGIVALTLSPMMCRYISDSYNAKKEPKIHKYLARLEKLYGNFLENIFSKNRIIVFIIISSIAISFGVNKFSAHSVIPKEDRNLVGIYIPPQPGKNMDDMENYEKQLQKIVDTIPEKKNSLSFIGYWGASVAAPLDAHKDRKRSQREIVASMEPLAKKIPSIDAWPWGWDSGIQGIGDDMGALSISFVITTTKSYKELSEHADKMIQTLNKTGKFIFLKHEAKFDTTQYDIIPDKIRLADLDIAPYQVSETINVFFDANRNLEFEMDDILYPINIKGNKKIWSLNEIYFINKNGSKVPIGNLAKIEENVSMSDRNHHNQMRSAKFMGMMMPPNGIESTMKTIETTAQKILPQSFNIEWTGAAEVQKEASGTMELLFLMAIIFIYAILAVQFNSFIDPIIIMITVPLACSGALLVNFFFAESINVYTQIGLITLVGLITKHGILIVEFANNLTKDGEDLKAAIIHSAKLRLRPILMTTGAMVLGAIPLAISTGAGSEARAAIGIVIISGLLFGTVFTLFVLPKVYYWVKSFRG
jgi:multidrug efflux pump